MRILQSLLVFLASSLIDAVVSFADDHPTHWQRYPFLGIPQIATAPTIDGEVDTREWFASARIGYLLDTKSGLAANDPSSIYLSYSPTHFYVAFQFERPEHSPLPGADDLFALHLDVGHTHTQAVVVAVNVERIVSESKVAAEYKARTTSWGWEGEIAIPFSALGGSTPTAGQTWGANFARKEKTPWERTLAWSYTGRFEPGIRNFGHLAFTGVPVAVSVDPAGWLQRNRQAGAVVSAANFSLENIDLNVTIQIGRAQQPAKLGFLPTIDDATTDDLGRPRGSTGDEIAKALKTYADLDKKEVTLHVPSQGRKLIRLAVADAPGGYLSSFTVKRGDTLLAAGVVPFWVPAPLGVELQGHLLLSKALDYEIHLDRLKAGITSNSVLQVEASGPSNAVVASERFTNLSGKDKIHNVFRFEPVHGANYEVTARLMDGTNIVAENKNFIGVPPKAAIPDWWTMKEGFEPVVPPPWTPVKASNRDVRILGRTYTYNTLALPSQIETRGQKILSGPIELRTSEPWKKSRLKLVNRSAESAVFESESVAENVKLTVRSQVEFDGFTYVDLELTANGTPHAALSPKGRGEKQGPRSESASQVSSPLAGENKGEGESVTLDKLDLVIPLKKEHAILMQNYHKAGGPGDFNRGGGKETGDNPYQRGKRFVGFVPDTTLQTPPMLTTWIGTDHYGLEWSCDSSRGWAMADPNKAMEISRDGDRVLFTIHFISKPIPLSDKPRRIRFGLVATPTKTLLPYLAKARFYDNYHPLLLPHSWGEYPVWHPPLKKKELIEKNLAWIGATQRSGKKVLINGGWNISAQMPEWEVWGKELISEPIQNVSYDSAKQFAACYRTPYTEFMAGSFAYNARLLGFSGIRFDTVVPNYDCNSLVHDCGWFDDDGNLWPSFSVFSQREIWKRLYRTFHGGVIKEGCIQTPNAAGPLMAVHSFSDHHEIGEGYYMHAKTLRDGMPPDMLRANMTGEQYGFRAEVNIKGGPLHWNEKIAACLVNGAEPRFEDHRGWKAGYEAQAKPAVSVWNAFDWVDRWNAQWLGHWENREFAIADCRLPIAQQPMVLPSLWCNSKLKRVLLVLGNYELEPMDEVMVKLDLTKLGLKGKVYAEDAITLEPVAIGIDGTMKLDVYGQRFRLIKISHEPPQYRDEVLSGNLLTNAPPVVDKSWQSAEVKLEPNSVYVVSAQFKIDKTLGEGSANPNVMTMFSPSIAHFVSMQLDGNGVHGIVATNTYSLCGIKGQEGLYPYTETPTYKQNYFPRHWEKTPGWMTVFLPVGTSSNATVGKVTIGVTDPGQAQVKDIAVRKLERR